MIKLDCVFRSMSITSNFAQNKAVSRPLYFSTRCTIKLDKESSQCCVFKIGLY